MVEWSVFFLTLAVLSVASVQDIMRREVSDGCWMALCALAAASQMMRGPWTGPVTAAATVLMSLYMFSPRVHGGMSVLTVGASVLIMIAVSAASGDPAPAVSAVMSLTVILLYAFGILRGGADAKALISLSMLYPVQPGIGALVWPAVRPDAIAVNPVLSASAIALVASVVWTLVITWRKSGRTFLAPGRYVVAIEEARRSFVWPVEDIVDGKKAPVPPSDDTFQVYERLEEAGYSEVAVTPMIPFIPMLGIGFFLTILLGSPMNLLIS